jgi:hypothetical protein
MLKINVLVMTVVFGFAGLFILMMFAWTEAKKYARAMRAVQRIAAPAHREPVAISRMTSRNSHRDSIRVA